MLDTNLYYITGFQLSFWIILMWMPSIGFVIKNIMTQMEYHSAYLNVCKNIRLNNNFNQIIDINLCGVCTIQFAHN